MKQGKYHIRQAQVHDLQAMHTLMLPFMQKNILIQRDIDNLYQHLQEFMVAVMGGQVVGVIALHIYGSNLAEVRSLVVSAQAQGLGIGRQLVQSCEKLAQDMGVSDVFALTYVDDFFVQQGYSIVTKESLPEKVWTVCVHCPKFSSCDEIAVKKQIKDE